MPKKKSKKPAHRPVKKQHIKLRKIVSSKAAAKKGRHKAFLRPKVGKTNPPTEAQIAELIKKGRLRGFITENEIFYVFRELEDYLDVYEAFLDQVEKIGIQIIEMKEGLLGRRAEAPPTKKSKASTAVA